MDIIKTLFDPQVTQEKHELAILEMLHNYDIPFSFDELSELFTLIRTETIEAWSSVGMYTIKYYPELFDTAMQNHPDFFKAILFSIKDRIITVRNFTELFFHIKSKNQFVLIIGCGGESNLKVWTKLINHYPFVIESFNLSDKIKKIINDSICGRNIKPANISNRTKNNQINIEK